MPLKILSHAHVTCIVCNTGTDTGGWSACSLYLCGNRKDKLNMSEKEKNQEGRRRLDFILISVQLLYKFLCFEYCTT